MTDEKRRIVGFVCTENNCLSPMAEGLFNKLTDTDGDIGDWFAKSAGLAVEKGAPALDHAIYVMTEFGVELGDHRATQLSHSFVKEAEVVLTMNEIQRDLLHLYFPKAKDKIFTLPEYLGQNVDIPDPSGGDRLSFQETAEILDKLVTQLVKKLESNL